MNIIEAVKIAREDGKFIKRSAWCDGSLLKVHKHNGLIYFANSDDPRTQWKPHASDIITDDWEIVKCPI